MNNYDVINQETEYLFNCNFFSDDFDPEDNCTHLDRAELLLDNYDWKDIFQAWNSFLHTKCPSTGDVINFCNLFVYYGGHENFIPDPYEFIGYLYYRINLDLYWDEASSVLDSIAIGILSRTGEVNLSKQPDYRPEKDSKIIAEVEKLKAAERSKK